jgi:hypothetical protein
MMDTPKSDWTATDVQRVLANPFYCVAGGPGAMISEEEWIKAGAQLISEIGAERYLRLVLENVKAVYGGEA